MTGPVRFTSLAAAWPVAGMSKERGLFLVPYSVGRFSQPSDLARLL